MPGRRQLIAGALVIGVLGLWLVISPGDALGRLSALIGSPWFPLLLVGGYAIRGVLGWPLTMLSAIVGFRYGVLLGLPIALVGAVGSTTLTWAIARHLQSNRGMLGRVSTTGRRYFDTAGDIRGVAAARLTPTPATAISAGAGIAGVSLPAFVTGTFLGVIPWTVGAVTIGASLESLTAADSVGLNPYLIGGSALLAVLLLAKPAYRTAVDRGWL